MPSLTLIAQDDGLVVDIVKAKFPTAFGDHNGVQIAHDIVEHQNGFRSIGPLWDEMEAVGAMLSVRRFTPEEWAENVPYFFSISNPADYIAPRRSIPCEMDDGFRYGLNVASEALDTDHPRVRNFLANAITHLRTGHRKMLRRFGGADRAADQFDAIRDAIAALREAYSPGDTFRLNYGRGLSKITQIG